MRTLNKVVITKIPTLHDYIVTAQFEHDKLVMLDCDNRQEKSILNNIYIGKVKNLVPNIDAAFIEIEKGYECYYSLTDNKNPIFINKKNNKKIIIGDEIIVQVVKENIKTKQPLLTSNIALTGKYVVVSAGDKKLGISNKLSLKERQRVKDLFADHMDGEYGIIARTNIKNAAKEDVIGEVKKLKNKLTQLIQSAMHRTCYSVLYEGEDNYISILKGLYEDSLEHVVTDDKEIYRNIHTYLTEQHMDVNRYLLFYEDSLLPLYKLKNLESEIKNATQERVWLKSGAYLVIQPTEAFTVVDINTGKFTGKKNSQETFLKINLEAAKEIARQLRIRNISGIVVIDFIDLYKDVDKKHLMDEFDKILKNDSITTKLVGMSQLNLVELTRKKVRKSLREQVMEPCRLCHASGYISKKE